ncbi:MAG TPA: hypothetical protein VFI31_14830 [Pirellulales bacterium]|nr:hypothetical protein [Pirellulales bacterium]
MSATIKASVLQALDLDAAIIESLPEPVLSELIGFIEYDSQLAREKSEAAFVRENTACRSSIAWPDS